MAQHNCEKCSFRAKYDSNSKSLIGRFWRWHINFCPNWKRYVESLDKPKKQELQAKYNLKK